MVSYDVAFAGNHLIQHVLILIVVEDGLVRREKDWSVWTVLVLILIVVEDGLVHAKRFTNVVGTKVLILIVVEDGLVRNLVKFTINNISSLNPYCSGRWSRTLWIF